MAPAGSRGLADVERWFARPAMEHYIIKDADAERLIAVF
jgi:hypothetical protein